MAGDQGETEGGGEMTVEERIVAALSPIGLPVSQGEYLGDRCKYLCYYVSRSGTNWANDGPGAEVCRVQVHLFAPVSENINNLVRLAQNALYEADFGWPEAVDATDKDGRHIILETTWLEAL